MPTHRHRAQHGPVRNANAAIQLLLLRRRRGGGGREQLASLRAAKAAGTAAMVRGGGVAVAMRQGACVRTAQERACTWRMRTCTGASRHRAPCRHITYCSAVSAVNHHAAWRQAPGAHGGGVAGATGGEGATHVVQRDERVTVTAVASLHSHAPATRRR